jgi:membrane protein implicated in regulation of membrane protease activity
MDAHTGRTQTSANEQELSAAEALERLQQQCGALYAYFLHFVSAKIDGLKLSGRHLAIWAIVAGLGVIGVVTTIIVAVVLLFSGLATGLGMAVGNAPWPGQIMVGLGLLVVFAMALLLGCRRVHSRARTRKVQHYVERQLQQRAQFGHSVSDRAHGTTV